MTEIDETEGEPLEPLEEPQEPAQEPGEAEEEEEGGAEPGETTEAEALAFDQLSEGEQAKILDKLDREAERHRNRLTEILKEEALSLLPCELCNPRHAGWVDLSQITPELRQRVRIMIGDREPVERRHDPYSARCEACNGEGEVETGSKVQGQTALPCLDCTGKGWIATGPERVTGLRVQPPAPAPQNGPIPVAPITVPTAPLSDEEQYHVNMLKERGFAVIPPVRT